MCRARRSAECRKKFLRSWEIRYLLCAPGSSCVASSNISGNKVARAAWSRGERGKTDRYPRLRRDFFYLSIISAQRTSQAKSNCKKISNYLTNVSNATLSLQKNLLKGPFFPALVAASFHRPAYCLYCAVVQNCDCEIYFSANRIVFCERSCTPQHRKLQFHTSLSYAVNSAPPNLRVWFASWYPYREILLSKTSELITLTVK